jgi:hypothetical protein
MFKIVPDNFVKLPIARERDSGGLISAGAQNPGKGSDVRLHQVDIGIEQNSRVLLNTRYS